MDGSIGAPREPELACLFAVGGESGRLVEEHPRVAGRDDATGTGGIDECGGVAHGVHGCEHRLSGLEVRGEFARDRHFRDPGLLIDQQHVGGREGGREVGVGERVDEADAGAVARERLHAAPFAAVTGEHEQHWRAVSFGELGGLYDDLQSLLLTHTACVEHDGSLPPAHLASDA